MDRVTSFKEDFNWVAQLKSRRSVRRFSDKTVPDHQIQCALDLANSAPSGANKQPWHFCIVKEQGLKKKLRILIESVEKKFYKNENYSKWHHDLKFLETDEKKVYIEEASHLIFIFQKNFSLKENLQKQVNYYAKESVGIASGFLIASLQLMGASCLTHTPTPMKFLCDFFGRPSGERCFMLLAVGYPHPSYQAPELNKVATHNKVDWY